MWLWLWRSRDTGEATARQWGWVTQKSYRSLKAAALAPTLTGGVRCQQWCHGICSVVVTPWTQSKETLTCDAGAEEEQTAKSAAERSRSHWQVFRSERQSRADFLSVQGFNMCSSPSENSPARKDTLMVTRLWYKDPLHHISSHKKISQTPKCS